MLTQRRQGRGGASASESPAEGLVPGGPLLHRGLLLLATYSLALRRLAEGLTFWPGWRGTPTKLPPWLLSDRLKEERKEAEQREMVDGLKHQLIVLEADVQMLRERRGRTIVERSLEDALEANARLTRRVDTLRQSLQESIVQSFDKFIAQARLLCPALDEADLSDLDPFKTVVDGVIREVEGSSSDEEATLVGGLGGRWRM